MAAKKKAKRKARMFVLYMAEASGGYIPEWYEWNPKDGNPPKGILLARDPLPRTPAKRKGGRR